MPLRLGGGAPQAWATAVATSVTVGAADAAGAAGGTGIAGAMGAGPVGIGVHGDGIIGGRTSTTAIALSQHEAARWGSAVPRS